MIFTGFLRSKKAFGLFLLPFILAAIVLLGYYFRPVFPYVASSSEGLLSVDLPDTFPAIWSTVLGGMAVLTAACLLFLFNARYKLLPHNTSLPSFFYLMLTAGLLTNRGFDSMLAAVLVSILAFFGLQGAISNNKTNAPVFNFGFCITLAVLLFPKFALLLLWAFCVLFFSGRSTLKDILALLLGIATPLLFVLFYYFWEERLEDVWPTFRESLVSGEYLVEIGTNEMIRYGFLLLLLIFSLFSLLTNYGGSVVSQRRGVFSLLSLLFFCSATIFAVPGISHDFMYLLAFPLSCLYANYFVTMRYSLPGDLLFLLFLGSCFTDWLIRP
ncbi:MAG: DUF6427 family protein [Culturomica sp.]|jgi:hypothetical protein|nr:DUF6427 family protein [Culturomica sp.]